MFFSLCLFFVSVSVDRLSQCKFSQATDFPRRSSKAAAAATLKGRAQRIERQFYKLKQVRLIKSVGVNFFASRATRARVFRLIISTFVGQKCWLVVYTVGAAARKYFNCQLTRFMSIFALINRLRNEGDLVLMLMRYDWRKREWRRDDDWMVRYSAFGGLTARAEGEKGARMGTTRHRCQRA